MPRYVIIGAGAVGGVLGARLVQAGRPAVLVARGDHLSALRSSGIRLRTPQDDVTLPVQAVSGSDEVDLRPDDVLVISTKTHQMAPVLTEWADAPVRDRNGAVLGSAGELLPVFTATNGVAAEDLTLRYFQRVFGICVWLPANLVAPGEVVARGQSRSGMLHIGRAPANTGAAEEGSLLDQVELDWTAAHFDIRRPGAVMPWKYRKLISNLGNIFQALLGSTRDARHLVAAADAEGRAVLDAAGIVYVDDAEESAARNSGFTVGWVPGIEGHLGGSTWQSLTRGTGDIETDYLNGEIAVIAHRHGITAPINSRLARLGRKAARTGAKPGDLSVEELAGELGLPAGSE